MIRRAARLSAGLLPLWLAGSLALSMADPSGANAAGGTGGAGTATAAETAASAATASAAVASGRAVDPAVALLPPPGLPPGWDQAGEPRLYAGEALYKHIDGGAEVYLSRGFRATAVALYQRGEAEVTVEVYDMASPAGALSIWKLNTGGAGSTAAAAVSAPPTDALSAAASDDSLAGSGSTAAPDSLGEAHAFDPYQILFRRGPWYVAVTRYDDSDSTAAALAALAWEVDRKILGGAGQR